jgi:putative ABC transport system permease protein
MKLIDLLIRLYPAEFRARYGGDMRAFHRDRVRENGASLPRIVLDHLASAVAERFRSLVQDVRYALRGIVRRPAFSAVVLATIALGVGANAAIFSVVNGILLRPLPYPHPDRVVAFGHKPPQWLVSQPEYLDYKRDLKSFETLAAFTQFEGNLSTEQEPERVGVAAVTLDFFAALGMQPMLGRTFAEDENRVAPATVAIVSHSLWQRRFAGDPALIGKTIMFNDRPRAVVGVMPERFDYPTSHTDVWLPMPRFNPDSLDDRANHYLFLVGRLRPGVAVDRANNEAIQLARRMMRDFADRYDPKLPLVPTIGRVSDNLLGGTRPYLLALVGAVGFILLIVCANVANLMLARGEGRRKEMALRTALGASSRRLTTQLLTESIVFALAGGALGVFLAWAGDRALLAAAPATIPRLSEIGVDWTVIAYALAISLVTGLLFGLVPALRAARSAPAETLKEGGKTASAHGGSRRMRRSLVMAEVALAVVMLSGAGMLLRSLFNLQGADLGFDPRGVFTAKVSPSNNGYSEPRAIAFYSQLLERVRAIPGVRSAGAAGWLPVVEAGGLWGLLAEGQSYEHLGQGPAAVPQQVTTGYFKSVGMPILMGRDFSERDAVDAPYVAVVSKAFVKMLWPNQDPLGKRFRLGGDSVFVSVVGVVSDIRSRGFDDTPEPTMYFVYPQTAKAAYFLPRSMSLVVRTAGDPMSIASQVRSIVRSLDATIPVSSTRTLEQVVGTSVANRRFSTALLAAFATLALVLAGIGIFGVISYGVSERTFEIGVRMALGAERSNVMRFILIDGLRMALVGIAIGIVGAAGVARAIRSLLVGVPTIDVTTLLLVAGGLTLVAIAASVIPARRAMAVSPTDALRAG